ncbi:hypothetical protein B0T24DRAFT_671102 [Lasiosphaeria ovina]|uniref:Uncharacterized protein n=1 Tax=Lasiosphaeria ovina TaxID=92902 RepID=A0AAE0JT80_9PEZI|nr:hypothetical protein B0T24DRAFT_671102 [Lasiosphaeria ovina]
MLFPGFPTVAAFAWGGFVSLAFAADVISASNEVDPDAVNACQCTGLDYSDSGSYLVDSSTSGNFSFASQFQGNCTDRVASPILRDPDNNEYHCTNIRPTPLGFVQISTWQVKEALHAMEVIWCPINGGNDYHADSGDRDNQRRTSRDALQTSTTTVRLPNTILTVTSTIIDYTTDDRITSSATTTSTVTASCVYKTTARSTAKTSSAKTSSVKSSSVKSTVKSSTAKPTSVTAAVTKTPAAPTGLFTFTVSNSVCAGNPPFAGAGAGGGWRGGGRGPPAWVTSMWASGAASGALPPWISCVKVAKRTEGPKPRIAAWTSTYVQTTFTATETSTVYLPPATVTRYILGTVTETITPPPSIVCSNAPDETSTIVLPGATLTRITLVTSASHVVETIFVTQTFITIQNELASQTACWRAGGTYGL